MRKKKNKQTKRKKGRDDQFFVRRHPLTAKEMAGEFKADERSLRRLAVSPSDSVVRKHRRQREQDNG